MNGKGTRSHKGCLECRRRKIKCDEAQPVCGRCRRAARPCSVRDAVFRPDARSFGRPARQTGDGQSSRIVWAAVSTKAVFQHDLPSCRPAAPCRPRNSDSDSLAAEADEAAFLLRHFADGPALAMDLFGPDQYFGRQVVALARSSALVRHAACALAARRMAQTACPGGRASRSQGDRLVVAAMARGRCGCCPDYRWHGAQHYERAVRLLAVAAVADDGEHGRAGEDSMAVCRAAICMLAEHERLAASLEAWAGYLDGLARLLRLRRPGQAGTAVAPSPASQTPFWHSVFQDWETSFVMHTAVRVDVDVLLTRLHMDSPHESTYLHRLICLLCRLPVDVWPSRHLSPPGPDEQREPTGQRVLDLQRDLDAWHDALPPSFTPDVRLPHVPRRAAPVTTEHGSLFAEELWFASRTCALAVAYYHTAQILLGVQPRPREHARAIVAIGLGMQGDTALQTYMVQPLFVAGRLLSDAAADADDRRRLLQMLRDIETELGVCTAYRVEGLEEEWGG